MAYWIVGVESTLGCVTATETGKLDCTTAGSWRCFANSTADDILSCTFGPPGSTAFVGAIAISKPRSGSGPLVIDRLPFKPLWSTLDALTPLVRFQTPIRDQCRVHSIARTLPSQIVASHVLDSVDICPARSSPLALHMDLVLLMPYLTVLY